MVLLKLASLDAPELEAALLPPLPSPEVKLLVSAFRLAGSLPPGAVDFSRRSSLPYLVPAHPTERKFLEGWAQ